MYHAHGWNKTSNQWKYYVQKLDIHMDVCGDTIDVLSSTELNIGSLKNLLS